MGYETIIWEDANGVEYPLTDQTDIDVIFDREGFFMPPVSYTDVSPPLGSTCGTTPTREGKVIHQLSIDPREIKMTLIVKAGSPLELRQAVRKYVKAFSPLTGEGKLKVTTPDGTRFLNCRYADGMQGQENKSNTSPLGYFQILKIVLIAYDPYWYSDITQTIPLTQTAVSTFFPIFPLTLNYDGVWTEQIITNDGEAVTYPVWKLWGPFNSARVYNLTTGLYFHVDAALGIGEYVTVDARPGNYLVQKGDGTNLFNSTSTDSRMFPFILGDNKIRIEFDSSDSTNTNVEVTYQNKYLTV